MSTTPKIGRTGEVEDRNVIGADQVAESQPDARIPGEHFDGPYDERGEGQDQVRMAQTGTAAQLGKLAIGQTVIYRYDDAKKEDAPAIVVRLNENGSVNLKVLSNAPENDFKENVFVGHGQNTWHHRGEIYVPTFNLDGTDRIRPTPFDAHEQIVRGPHTHSLDGGYRTAGVAEEYVPQEFPKVVDVNEETGEPVLTHGPDDKVHADIDKKKADEANAARERNQAGRAPYETPADRNAREARERVAAVTVPLERNQAGIGSARLQQGGDLLPGETPAQLDARIAKDNREEEERAESASREGGPQLGKRAARQV